jgi:16S rRNA processing protein RimM
LTLVTAGRVGKPHGLDGSFYVERAQHELPEGSEVVIAGTTHRIVRRSGTDQRPLVRLEGIEDPRRLGGEVLLVEDELGEGEWLAADLIGCSVPGLGSVQRVIDAPSCSLLELEDGTLVPFVSEAIERVDTDAREIQVRPGFLP